jgi:hypothetical protein
MIRPFLPVAATIVGLTRVASNAVLGATTRRVVARPAGASAPLSRDAATL